MDTDKFISWIFLLSVVSLEGYTEARARARYRYKDELKARVSHKRIRRPYHSRAEKPNIIVVMTDDMDEVLGSPKTMTKTMRILRDNGAHCVNSFVSTPMCCPSRSSFLTGMYPHNHNVYTNNGNCSSPQWQQTHESRNFATYLSNVGYRTGYFGKYLNEYNGKYTPPGWREWVGLVKNSKFYNYTINFNGKMIKHGDNYYKDYFTDLIANDSVTFLKQSKQYFPNRPVMMMLSVPAPHGPEDAAPQYQHMFFNNTDHRTRSWNYAPNADKQWLLKLTGKMQPIHQRFTDLLHQKRLQTLQSVDDLIEKVHRELKSLGELDNSYIIFTSDHGYHLGQYGLVKGKAMPYDFDVRVPLFIRGPGIYPGTKLMNLVANIDIAPTILDMAGVDIPDHMDGRSILKLLTKAEIQRSGPEVTRYKKGWRDSILLTRGKVTHRKLLGIIKAEKRRIFSKLSEYDADNSKLKLVLTRRERKLVRMCLMDEYKSPCKPGQEFECRTLESGDLHLARCEEGSNESLKLTIHSDTCMCPDPGNNTQSPHSVGLGGADFQSNLIRQKRSEVRISEIDLASPPLGLEGQMEKCRVLPNNSVQCERELYQSVVAWRDHKDRIDEMIQFYKQKLENLKGIRKHLKRKRPIKEDFFPAHNFSHTIGQPTITVTSEGSRQECQCYPNEGDTEEYEEQEVLYGDPGVDDDFDNAGFDDDTDDIFSLGRNRSKNRRDKSRKRRKNLKRKIMSCHSPQMNCFTHDNNHWKTPPYWSDGPFCFCPNSGNCTYWCLRTINETHNFLYCEFITQFISFYNMTADPDQLRNAVYDLNYGVLQQLHEQLNELRACKGPKDCSLRIKPDRHGKGSRHRHHNRSEKSEFIGRAELRGRSLRPKSATGWSEDWTAHRRALLNWG